MRRTAMKCASALATVAGLLLMGAMACTTGTEPLASDPEPPEGPESPGQEPPPDPNPEPPPPPPPSGDCTMIVDAADGPPDAQINTAQAGDVVCLVGAFTLDHVFRAEVRDGVNGNLFDLQVANVTVDGAAATVTGDFDQADNVILVISASNTRLTGFEIETGIVHVASGISNVTTDNNHIFNAVVPNSNQGLIRTLGLSNGVGPGDVLIENNVIENLYGCDADDAFGTFPPCSPGTAKPWDQVSDVEHLACIVKQGTGGDHTVRNNTIGACPSLMYLKHASDDRID